FLTTRPRGMQMATNSRIPGRININNVWDIETWRALCDAQIWPNGANLFTPAMIDQMFYDMIQSRSPSNLPPTGPYNSSAYFYPTGGDRPFRGAAGPFSGGVAAPPDPQYPAGAGPGDTIFRRHPV